ncbi:MAG: hypothetical protein HOV80_21105 [Polyangiaceae bacterium]|nr:hypothetical protein [Polyangiaceae bacterium]
MRRLISLAFCSLALALGTGCGSLLEDRCDAICECENCGDREREACETEVDGDYQIADIYGCTDQLEAYFECQLQEYQCDNRQYRDDPDAAKCVRAAEDYEGCRQNTSARDRGPYGNPGPQSE